MARLKRASRLVEPVNAMNDLNEGECVESSCNANRKTRSSKKVSLQSLLLSDNSAMLVSPIAVVNQEVKGKSVVMTQIVDSTPSSKMVQGNDLPSQIPSQIMENTIPLSPDGRCRRKRKRRPPKKFSNDMLVHYDEFDFSDDACDQDVESNAKNTSRSEAFVEKPKRHTKYDGKDYSRFSNHALTDGRGVSKRQQRMASLNALAKVNAVFESYLPQNISCVNHGISTTSSASARAKDAMGVCDKGKGNMQRLTSSKLTSKVGTESRSLCKSATGSVSTSETEKAAPLRRPSTSSNDGSDEMSNDSNLGPHELKFDGQDAKIVNKSECPSNFPVVKPVMVDKDVQTVVNNKCLQTEMSIVYNDAGCSRDADCVCFQVRMQKINPAFTYYCPQAQKIYPNICISIDSHVIAKTAVHAVAVPFRKAHTLRYTDFERLKQSSDLEKNAQHPANIRFMCDQAIRNVLNRYSHSCAKLIGLTTWQQEALANEQLYQDSVPSAEDPVSLQNKPLSLLGSKQRLNVPRISFSPASGEVSLKLKRHFKGFRTRSMNATIEHRLHMRKQEPYEIKSCNGWKFDGDPVEKAVSYVDQLVIRRHYTCLRRHNEVISIRDSVLLKSGMRKKDLPFVARVASIWEEIEGPFAGDMMMSVFWYYRPEQTDAGRLPDVHGEMEVFASRHRDDNSVACLVDKCYVVSYAQYCRYRSRRRLLCEQRHGVPPSPVPPAHPSNASEAARLTAMPSPKVDPSLVFFCRQVYDYRTGKIAKNSSY